MANLSNTLWQQVSSLLVSCIALEGGIMLEARNSHKVSKAAQTLLPGCVKCDVRVVALLKYTAGKPVAVVNLVGWETSSWSYRRVNFSTPQGFCEQKSLTLYLWILPRKVRLPQEMAQIPVHVLLPTSNVTWTRSHFCGHIKLAGILTRCIRASFCALAGHLVTHFV